MTAISHPLRLLLVEDSEVDAHLIVRALQTGGYAVTQTRVAGPDAMRAALVSGNWDAVIADHAMPGFSAPAALALLKAEGWDLPFLIVSGGISQELAVEAMRAGAHDYLSKDNLTRLVPALERELREAEVRRRRRQAEADLWASREQLRALAAYLEQTREAERARIARDLHDELGQLLTALKIDAVWLQQQVDPARPQETERIAGMLATLQTALQSVRSLAAGLRPRLLDQLGLPAALEWQATEFRHRTGLPCTLVVQRPADVDDDLALMDSELATALFRITQEALTNVARHAHATRVAVALVAEPEVWRLTIQDDGRGFTASAAEPPRTFGLLGMRERLLPWGGELFLAGEPGRGTTVTVTGPRTPGAPEPRA